MIRECLDALGPTPRAGLLHVLTLPDFERAGRIGQFHSNPDPTFARQLIDAEEDQDLRAVLVGLLLQLGR